MGNKPPLAASASLTIRRYVGLLCLCGLASSCLAQPSIPEKLIESGHWKQARAIVEAQMREDPQDPLAYFLLSQIRNAFGDRSMPLPLAEKAVALNRRTAKYHRQVAEVVGVIAQHSNAFQLLLLARRFRKEIDAALALDPRDVQTLRDLTEFYLLAPGIAGGDRQQASEVAERIAAIDPAEGFLARARLAGFHGRPAETEVLLQRAAEAQPPSYRARIALARFYLAPEHHDPQAAAAAAKEALTLDPARAEAQAQLATVYADCGAWSDLESALARTSRESPDDLVPYYRAAERLLASGRHLDKAERYLSAYLAREPEGNEPTAADAKRQLNLVEERTAK